MAFDTGAGRCMVEGTIWGSFLNLSSCISVSFVLRLYTYKEQMHKHAQCNRTTPYRAKLHALTPKPSSLTTSSPCQQNKTCNFYSSWHPFESVFSLAHYIWVWGGWSQSWVWMLIKWSSWFRWHVQWMQLIPRCFSASSVHCVVPVIVRPHVCHMQ